MLKELIGWTVMRMVCKVYMFMLIGIQGNSVLGLITNRRHTRDLLFLYWKIIKGTYSEKTK